MHLRQDWAEVSENVRVSDCRTSSLLFPHILLFRNIAFIWNKNVKDIVKRTLQHKAIVGGADKMLSNVDVLVT